MSVKTVCVTLYGPGTTERHMNFTLFAALGLSLSTPQAQESDSPAARMQDSPPITAESLLDLWQTRQVGNAQHPCVSNVFQLTGTIKVQEMPLEGTYTETHHPAGMGQIRWSFPGYGDTVEASDGHNFWEISPMGEDLRVGWRGSMAYRVLALRRCVPWNVMYAKAELADAGEDGPPVVMGEPCHRLLMTPKSPKELGIEGASGEEAPPASDVWFLGKHSYLLHRVQMEATVPNRGSGTLTIDLNDWRLVNGRLVPFRTSREMHGFTMVSQVNEVETGLELDEEFFAMPEKVRELQGDATGADPLPDQGWEVVEVDTQHTVVIRTKCKPEELSRTLAGILPEVMRYVSESGGEVAGPPFSRYHEMGDTEIDMEAGIPVASPVESKGRMTASTLPGGRAVVGDHIGEYHRLGESHSALETWMKAKGERSAGPTWEIYWTDPGIQPDPKKWRTQIVMPLRKKK